MPFVPSYAPFFPLLIRVDSTTELSAQPTAGVTPSASLVVFTTIGEYIWQLWTLTAGAHVADETHVLPLDYNASTNAKHWALTNSGTIGAENILIDDDGNALVDENGNKLSFA